RHPPSRVRSGPEPLLGVFPVSETQSVSDCFPECPGVKLEAWQEASKRLTMPIEQMNISLPPKRARFIRSKVKDGQYTNASEVVRDAVRHMQETEAARSERALLADFEAHLPAGERKDIRRSVKRGIQDIDAGQFEEYGAE